MPRALLDQSKRKVSAQVNFPPDLLAELDEIAKRREVSRSALICDGVRLLIAEIRREEEGR